MLKMKSMAQLRKWKSWKILFLLKYGVKFYQELMKQTNKQTCIKRIPHYWRRVKIIWFSSVFLRDIRDKFDINETTVRDKCPKSVYKDLDQWTKKKRIHLTFSDETTKLYRFMVVKKCNKSKLIFEL